MPTDNKILPFCNAHSHIFTVNHAPDYFLRTVIRNDFLANLVQRLLQKNGPRSVMKFLLTILKITSPNHRNMVERYIEIIQTGIAAQQKDIFDMEASAYTRLGAYKIVVLTQVLDFLDYDKSSAHKKIQTQVEEVVELKRSALYQDRLLPFLGVDPRIQGVNLAKWVEKYISKDFGFCGIKFYPAYGFFPFDIRLDPVWEWAEKNEIPVMTHCTRGGSFYLGSFDSVLNRGGFQPQSLNPGSPAMKAINNRIAQLVQDQNRSVKRNNKVWCNVFGHPENYRPVLEKYPRLKLCLAHLGGADEVIRSVPANLDKHKPDYPPYLGPNWYREVIALMTDYGNVYSDISYTLSDKKALQIILDTFRSATHKDLINRLMYGTDFYLTRQEEIGNEPDLINIFLNNFNNGNEVKQLAYINPDQFLRSVIHPY
jgi:predicted TIM-barrel fold metal-dependent hydrolase